MAEGQARAGVFGKLAAKRDRRTLHLENYLPALPPPPEKFDAIPRVQHGASIPSNRRPSIRRLFPMDGNDEYGCCVVAAVAHAETCWNGWCGKRRIPGRQKVVNTYFALTGGEDVGLVEIDTLNVWRKRGLLGEKILAYAYVSPTNLDHVKSAISIFGSLFVGFVVQQGCIRDFNHGITWTPGPRTDSGHAVLITGYDAEGVTLLTWGESCRATWGWLQAMCDELYVILPGESTIAGFVPGFDFAALKQDLLLVQG